MKLASKLGRVKFKKSLLLGLTGLEIVILLVKYRKLYQRSNISLQIVLFYLSFLFLKALYIQKDSITAIFQVTIIQRFSLKTILIPLLLTTFNISIFILDLYFNKNKLYHLFFNNYKSYFIYKFLQFYDLNYIIFYCFLYYITYLI